MFIWPDSMPDAAWVLLFLVVPLGLFDPVWGTLQFACVFFVWIRAIRHYRRRPQHEGHGCLALSAWIIGGYIAVVFLTNLLFLGLQELN